MLPQFCDDGFLFGDKDKGLEFTNNDVFLYDNGEKRQLLRSDEYFLWNACQCQIAGSLPAGTYRLNEVEMSICQKCGGMILTQKSTKYLKNLHAIIGLIEQAHDTANGSEKAILGEALELLGGVTSGGTKG